MHKTLGYIFRHKCTMCICPPYLFMLHSTTCGITHKFNTTITPTHRPLHNSSMVHMVGMIILSPSFCSTFWRQLWILNIWNGLKYSKGFVGPNSNISNIHSLNCNLKEAKNLASKNCAVGWQMQSEERYKEPRKCFKIR